MLLWRKFKEKLKAPVVVNNTLNCDSITNSDFGGNLLIAAEAEEVVYICFFAWVPYFFFQDPFYR